MKILTVLLLLIILGSDLVIFYKNSKIVSCGMEYGELKSGKVVYRIFNIRQNGNNTKPIYSGIADKEDADELLGLHEKEIRLKYENRQTKKESKVKIKIMLWRIWVFAITPAWFLGATVNQDLTSFFAGSTTLMAGLTIKVLEEKYENQKDKKCK